VKKILYILLLTLVIGQAMGQGIVEGVVTDAANNHRLEFVNVGVMGKSVGTVTNGRGFYQLRLSETDSLTLRFSFTGYEPQEHRVFLEHGKAVRVNVSLKQVAQQLQAVEVNDEKSRQSSFTQIEVQKLESAVGPTGGVEALIKMLPDVSSHNELSSQYSVRGGSFDENLVYINDIEIFRPMLIRSGQQEGLSIINPDLVDYILFSPGGFDATYGDKLSSVLDITYSRPQQFKAKISGSLLGASASAQGRVGERFSYAVALRQHSNRYILGSMDTKGRYTTSYTDIQSIFGYHVNDKLDLSAMAIWTRNVYGLVPESATTTFGTFFQPLVLNVYFDGQEQDKYNTLLGSFLADYHPNDDWTFKNSISVQHVNESERFDVQSQYWLYELGMGESAGDTMMFDRGVGTFLEHARNRLVTDIFTANLRAIRQVKLGTWTTGLTAQLEQIDDHLREWKWVDSAGYPLPYVPTIPGDSSMMPVNPILQQYVNSNNTMQTWRVATYTQRELNFVTRKNAELKVLLGLRAHVYESTMESNGVSGQTKPHLMLSPRVSVNYKPKWEKDFLFRLATGIYHQAPFYREYRRDDGTLQPNLKPQTSYQTMATADWNLRIWDKPFKITADIYYKYITDLIPYTVDNLRIRYMPDASAVGYTTGLSLRINGELIEGLESWASFSLMQARQDIDGDGLGWLPRPTDQRLSFKVFLQDNIPDMPWWRMSLNLIYGTGTPVHVPYHTVSGYTERLPSYYRIDWGNTIQFSQIESLKNTRLMQFVDDIQISLEVFNLFNFRNVISYLWVSDYENRSYPVPNYLTARQLNLKVTVLFR